MALRRVLSAVRAGVPRHAPLSTVPAAREQPTAGPRAVPERGAAEASRPPVPAVDFGNAQEAYRSRRNWELVRNLLVLRLCASPALLARHEQLLCVARRLLGQRLFDKLMKMTFYGQFVAGEDQQSIRPLIQHNRAFGVGSILDYGVEEDLSPEEAEQKEMESCTSAAERDGSGTSKREKQYQAHRAFGDRRDGVISARTYFYANEAKCDGHMETFLRCIEASGGVSDDGFSAIKLTALGRPQFLLQFSDVLTKWRRFFHQMAAEQGKAELTAMDMKLEVAALQESVAKMGIASRAEIEDWFTTETLGVSGTVDLLDWSSLIDGKTKLSKHLVVPNPETGQLEPLLSRFTEEEELQMTRMLQRMDILAKKATEVGVRLMVDAEQTYFQPAISRLTLEMQRKFNVEKPLIFNTYQCYLQDAYDNVTLDVELARREGWCFGAKLVRGAYMAQERTRAAEIGYEDPINPTYEDTNAMYHRCLNYVLEELKHNAKAKVMVASHNEDTVRFTLGRCSVHYRKWCIEVSSYYYKIVCYSLQFCHYLLHIFWGSNGWRSWACILPNARCTLDSCWACVTRLASRWARQASPCTSTCPMAQ
ncbi:proline dehydrogenase 1, mitochondrial isoform X2 [Elephas maximus indicus]|uniref:proline dehydrogenase 1, mitochondrial isoform X2 n=1 Tax=Elephas maximus indicus TaxID=99487 RepID=UPI00211649A5|nr:proline dehydrogenase 1, mitochondrial isoform X2 [Elephas maximus indicus]